MFKRAWIRILETTIASTPDFRGKGWLFQFPARPCIDEPIRTAYGVRLKCRLYDYTNRASVFGHYGHDVANVVASIPQGSVFVDIGGNAGLFSSIAAQTLGADGTIIAFEPQPELCQLLAENTSLNGPTPVLLFNLAVASQARQMTLSPYNARHSGLAYLGDTQNGRLAWAANIDEDLPIVEEVIAGRPTTIKIDVEGAELEALKGISKLLAAPATTTVIIEIDPDHLARFSASPDQVYTLMHDAGFMPTSEANRQHTHYDEIFRRSQPSPA
ncbi:FkbM family methyltransferase [Salinisphaera sp. SPP-AMP-43]|uniref:FkbM family methyltransferase n=1 Tax=Salinisphaera sp. SPP-AMP-43 TaxID=3121288 RepID=UPI003C6E369B